MYPSQSEVMSQEISRISPLSKITSRRRYPSEGSHGRANSRCISVSIFLPLSHSQVNHGRAQSRRLRTLSSFWKYSRRKEIGFSGRPTHSCTIQSFRTCWILCLCTYSSHSRKLCSSSRFAAILMMHGAPLYRRYVAVATPPRRCPTADLARDSATHRGYLDAEDTRRPPSNTEDRALDIRKKTEGKFKRDSGEP